jgi:hypothetical protein
MSHHLGTFDEEIAQGLKTGVAVDLGDGGKVSRGGYLLSYEACGPLFLEFGRNRATK